jgi:hypothetical protein
MKCFTYVVPGKKNALQVIYLQSVIQIFCDPAGSPFIQQNKLIIKRMIIIKSQSRSNYALQTTFNEL